MTLTPNSCKLALVTGVTLPTFHMILANVLEEIVRASSQFKAQFFILPTTIINLHFIDNFKSKPFLEHQPSESR